MIHGGVMYSESSNVAISSSVHTYLIHYHLRCTTVFNKTLVSDGSGLKPYVPFFVLLMQKSISDKIAATAASKLPRTC